MSVWSSVAIIFKTSLWWGTCSIVGTWNHLLAWLQGQRRLWVPRLGAPGCGRLVVRQQLGWLVGSLLWFHEFCLSSVIYVEKVFFGCDLQAWFSDLRWGRKRWELQDCMPLLFGDLWVAQEGDRLWCQGVFCHMAAYTEVLGVPPSSLELELGASCVVPWLLSLFHKLRCIVAFDKLVVESSFLSTEAKSCQRRWKPVWPWERVSWWSSERSDRVAIAVYCSSQIIFGW